MAEFDTVPVLDACQLVIERYRTDKDLRSGEQVPSRGLPYCTCGRMLWEHRLDLRKAPREHMGPDGVIEKCAGFVLDHVEVNVCRVVKLQVPTS